jgi:hypothetical protein
LHTLIDHAHPTEMAALATQIKSYCHSNVIMHGLHAFYRLIDRFIAYSLDVWRDCY